MDATCGMCIGCCAVHACVDVGRQCTGNRKTWFNAESLHITFRCLRLRLLIGHRCSFEAPASILVLMYACNMHQHCCCDFVLVILHATPPTTVQRQLGVAEVDPSKVLSHAANNINVQANYTNEKPSSHCSPRDTRSRALIHPCPACQQASSTADERIPDCFTIRLVQLMLAH